MRFIRCTFSLNNKETSWLYCNGFRKVEAFSGQKQGRDNPTATNIKDIGPIPKGIYYLVDRQSGGKIGFLYDLWYAYGFGSTDHTKWFMLWNPKTGDNTIINGVRRGNFRLHPMGERRLSEGCITVVNPSDFERLQRHIRFGKPDLPVPGTSLKAYGTLEVQ